MTDSAQKDTVIVPAIALEETPRLSAEERRRLIADLQRIEADMDEGKFETYSHEWLRARFRKAYGASND